MDLGLREWLLILGPLLIIAVLAHGLWRMRNSPRKVRVELDKNYVSRPGESMPEDELDPVRGELPNGGARIVQRFAQTRESPGPSSARANRKDLERDVPVLMEPVDVPSGDSSQLSFGPLIADPKSAPVGRKKSSGQKSKAAAEASAAPEPKAQPEPAPREPAPREPTPKPAPVGKPEQLAILVVHTRNDDELVDGKQLLDKIVDAGMHFSDNGIFQYRDKATREVQFSLVNAVEPGTFDLEQMHQMQTPGVSLFMKVHEVTNPAAAFERMVAVAKLLARELDCVVKDQNFVNMTNQALSSERQRVKDYMARNSPLLR